MSVFPALLSVSCASEPVSAVFFHCKEALKYLNQERFVQNYELRQVKEEVRRMEVVKREFIKENKKEKPERYH